MKTTALFLPFLCIGLVACNAEDKQSIVYVSGDGGIKLQHPEIVQRSTEFRGRALLQGGWRVVWDGSQIGEGREIVRLTLPARAADGSALSEILQIGVSRDPSVITSCLSYGLNSGNGMHLPKANINGHDWTVYSNGDAGMSQSTKALNYRLLFDNACYAMDRISYAVRAAKAADNVLSEADATKLMDGVKSSVEVMPTAH